jgi:hypothetical protein
MHVAFSDVTERIGCVRCVLRQADGLQEAVDEDDETAAEALRIRGFRTRKAHGLRIDVRQGDMVLDAVEIRDARIVFSPKEERAEYLAGSE